MNLKCSYKEVVKRIGRYLKFTANKGIVCKFDATKPIEVFVDANFAGTWNLEESDLLILSLSQSGHVIKVANCSIYWVSKMQTKVALSATEAEYITLSQSTRDLISTK